MTGSRDDAERRTDIRAAAQIAATRTNLDRGEPVNVISHVITVPVHNGQLLCSQHHEPLVQQGDRWLCPLEEAINDFLRTGYEQALARVTATTDGAHQ